MNKIQAGNLLKIIVAIGLIALIGYNLGQKIIGPILKNEKTNNVQTHSNASLQPQQNDLTKDWKTYKDASGYSLKYPPTLSVEKINDRTLQIGDLKIEIREGAFTPFGDKITIGNREATWIQDSGTDTIYLPFPNTQKTLIAVKPTEDKGGDNTLFRIIDSIRF